MKLLLLGLFTVLNMWYEDGKFQACATPPSINIKHPGSSGHFDPAIESGGKNVSNRVKCVYLSLSHFLSLCPCTVWRWLCLSVCPLYAHIWRYKSARVPFMSIYGDICICLPVSLLCLCDLFALDAITTHWAEMPSICPYLEISVSVSPCPFYAHIGPAFLC